MRGTTDGNDVGDGEAGRCVAAGPRREGPRERHSSEKERERLHESLESPDHRGVRDITHHAVTMLAVATIGHLLEITSRSNLSRATDRGGIADRVVVHTLTSRGTRCTDIVDGALRRTDYRSSAIRLPPLAATLSPAGFLRGPKHTRHY